MLLLLLLTALSTPAAAANCPTADPVCTIRDATVTGAQLLAQLSDATRTLLVRNVRLADWQQVGAGLDATAGRRARQLEHLTLDSVTWTTDREGAAAPRLGEPFASLRSLTMRGSGVGASCPFNGAVGLRQLTDLSLVDCKAGPLDAGWLRDLPALRRLTVDSAKVDSIQLAALDQATRAALVDIRLANNSFNRLTDETFGSMPNLENLTLDGNIVQYIDLGAFAQLPRLRELSIELPREGQLAKIWDNSLAGRFDNNTQLETLRLVNARLAENQIASSFVPLRRLRGLDLRGHRLHRLNNSVLASLAALEWLDLSDGSLACLYDRNFGVMSRLRRLNLANNGIRVIGQRALLGLQSLASLNLTGNPVQAIEPGAFCSLPVAVKSPPGLLADWAAGNQRRGVHGAANISDPCPADFDPNRLILSSPPQCLMPKPVAADGAGQPSSQQSRHTFLIIIGLCVAFLIITVISMMAYKGWSKRKNAQLAKDEEKELELQAMVAAAEDGGGAGGSDGAHRKSQNGRQHHHHHHHSAGKKAAAAAGGGSNDESQKQAPSPQASSTAAAAAAGGNNGEVETKAQVESPERSGGQAGPEAADQQQASPDSAAAAAAPGSSKQPRPGITLMHTVPEDSDLEARAITTLVVV